MRNLKKILALVLAMVMAFSVMATANAALADLDSVDPTYDEAVQVLTALGVFEGRENNGTTLFDPQGEITRAEVAAIIYRIVTGDVKDKQVSIYADYNKFDDVKSTAWYAGYVNFCANAEYILGDGTGNFNPTDNVTGYQALAMILRAIGYDKNGEFSGAGWQVQTAAVGKKLGITDNVSAGTLGTAASREVVAEILFQTLLVPQVEYTVAFGYQPISIANTKAYNASLGYETFKLTGGNVGQDVFGRPGNLWYANGKKLVLVAYDAVASYTVKVDECDIANDMGLTKTTDIESLWIDGIVDNDQNDGKINPYSTTKNVGAQGRLTEVYDMGKDGVRIVEINTYLAQVEAVKATSTDKNGHVTDGYVTFNVYGVTNNLPYETEDFVYGQWALVTVSNPNTTDEAVESAVATAATTVGYTTDWDTATTTIGKTEYNDADKFILAGAEDTPSAKSSAAICWDVFVDQYGNIIGAVETASNYLVVEKIEWKHAAATIGEGYALADIVLANGDKVANVTIAEVNGEDVTNSDYLDGNTADATVADSYVNNGDGYSTTGYYGHIWTYTVDENGAYSIVEHDSENDGEDALYDYDETTVVNGKATIDTNTNDVVATSATVFLIEDTNGYTYSVYVGKDNVPSGTADTMCVLKGTDGYADLVVLKDWTPAGNTFFAYVTDANVDGNSTALGKKYKVYKVGETTATIVYDAGTVLADAYVSTGIYELELNNKGQLVSVSADYVADLSKTEDWIGTAWAEAGVTYVRAQIDAKHELTSIQVEEYSNLTAADNGNGYTTEDGAAWADFNVTEDTIVIKAHKTALDGTAKLTAGTIADVAVGDVVIIGYKAGEAKVIYVFSATYTADPVSTYAWEYKNATMDTETGAQVEIELVKDGKTVMTLKDVSNLDVTVTVYNKAGTQVYSTTVEAQKSSSGNLLVVAPHTLGATNEYKAVVTIGGSTLVGAGVTQTVETPYIEAQTTTATQPQE